MNRKFRVEKTGYVYSGLHCRGYKSWQVTVAPSGRVYTIAVHVGRDGTNTTGYVFSDDKMLASLSCGSYRKCLHFIKEREQNDGQRNSY